MTCSATASCSAAKRRRRKPPRTRSSIGSSRRCRFPDRHSPASRCAHAAAIRPFPGVLVRRFAHPMPNSREPMTHDEQIEEVMRRVRKMELKARRLVKESFAGEYQSSFRGQGLDFDDFREYQHGDEIRFIDWNVTARMGSP